MRVLADFRVYVYYCLRCYIQHDLLMTARCLSVRFVDWSVLLHFCIYLANVLM